GDPLAQDRAVTLPFRSLRAPGRAGFSESRAQLAVLLCDAGETVLHAPALLRRRAVAVRRGFDAVALLAQAPCFLSPAFQLVLPVGQGSLQVFERLFKTRLFLHVFAQALHF